MSSSKKEINALFENANLSRRHVSAMIKVESEKEGEDFKLVAGKIDSIFYSEIMPICWYSIETKKYDIAGTETERVFTPPKGNEYVMSSYIEFTLPAIGVKDSYRDRYRIAWGPNVGNNVIESCVTKIDEYITLQTFDNHWLNIEPHFFRKMGFDDECERGIGNTPELQTFGFYLPSHNVRANQPFFYSYSSTVAFPLFLMNSQSTFKHEYKFIKKIDKLLCMQELVGDKWVPVPVDMSALICSSNSIGEISLYGKFCNIKDTEIEWNKCEVEETLFYTNDVCICDSDTESSLTNNAKIELKSSAPATAIFFFAHNVTAEKEYNIRSKYNMTGNNLSPIHDVNMKLGEKKIIGKHHFTGINLLNNFDRATDKDILCYAISDRPGTTKITVGIPLSVIPSEINVKLSNVESSRWLSDKTDVRGSDAVLSRCDDKFIMRARVLVQHEIYIDKAGLVSFRDE